MNKVKITNSNHKKVTSSIINTIINLENKVKSLEEKIAFYENKESNQKIEKESGENSNEEQESLVLMSKNK